MKGRLTRVLIMLMMLATLFVAVPTAASAAVSSATIDFEDGLAAGDIVSVLDVGLGISGSDAGSVAVEGTRSDLALVNQAMIFDAECGGAATTCSGDDPDLFQPTLGNVLIISEDNDPTDPDDADVGELFVFDFTGWGPGEVTVVSIDVLDVEADESGAYVDVDGATVAIPEIGDGNVATVPVALTGTILQVVLNGSGAIDNIVIEWGTPGGEGCTPGYWKNLRKHGGSWVGYAPGDDFEDVFGVDGYDVTLIEALRMGGGGMYALGRHAVAALLSASNPDVDYMYSSAQVISAVQAAFDSGRFQATKNAFAAQNEMGCSVGNTGPYVGG